MGIFEIRPRTLSSPLRYSGSWNTVAASAVKAAASVARPQQEGWVRSQVSFRATKTGSLSRMTKALGSGILSSHNTADFTLYGEIQLHVLMMKPNAWEGRS